ncbi:MAG: NAD(P)/FAD-dependent oxidoreductase [bacterium]|nr:MAG: NAD(P)/FAD-dependent oxidoreductase [bacterium]
MRECAVIIIGGGPAGIACAVQLRRGGVEPVLVESDAVGGLLRNANLVENYPGFPCGIEGPELAKRFAHQLDHAGVHTLRDEVEHLTYKDGGFHVRTGSETIRARIAVVATGTKPKRLGGITIPDGAQGRVYYEVYPLREVRNKRIAIVGAGDAAFDYALSLSRHNEVSILGRSDAARCIPVLRERCYADGNITWHGGTVLEEVVRAEEGLVLGCDDGGGRERWEHEADYVVIAIGREPCLDFLGSETAARLGDLAHEGVLHLVGDVKNDIYRQTAICVGDGVRAAMCICRHERTHV